MGIRLAKDVNAAAERVRHIVDKLTTSWRQLNPQLQWSINDRIVYVGLGRHTLAAVKWEMQDGSDFYWQDFWLLAAETQLELIRAAIARLDAKGGK